MLNKFYKIYLREGIRSVVSQRIDDSSSEGTELSENNGEPESKKKEKNILNGKNVIFY